MRKGNSLRTGKLTGNFANSAFLGAGRWAQEIRVAIQGGSGEFPAGSEQGISEPVAGNYLVRAGKRDGSNERTFRLDKRDDPACEAR